MGLRVAGVVLASSAVTLAVGYWLGDQGVRWFPDTVDILLVCLFAGVCCLLAAAIGDGGMQKTPRGVKVRKRVLALCAALAIVGVIRLVGRQMQEQTALTRLSPEAFGTMVSAQMEQLEGLDREMESLLVKLEGHAALAADQALSPEDETFLRQAWLSLYDTAFAVDQIRRGYQDWYRFDVGRTQRPYHVQSFLMEYGADVILYDKAMRIIETVKRNPNAATFLNAPHPDSAIGEGSFSRFQLELFGADCSARMNAGRAYLGWLDKGLAAHTAGYCGSCLPLWSTLEGRLAMLDAIAAAQHGKAMLDADMELLRRGANRVWFPAQKGVAEWMGGTRLQRPGEYLIGAALQAQLDGRLEPGDVMLGRKNWYMSNVGLPGFWPHAILYIGEPGKLCAYMDDPAVAAYLKGLAGKEISFEQYMAQRFGRSWRQYGAGTGAAPYRVIEAIKHGVLLNPLAAACGDYMVALRPRLDKVAKAQAIIEAFSHLDKPYDFDFDFATDHALVCTEVVWRSYRPGEGKAGLTFKLSDIAGRKTLPANEIARQYRDEKQAGQSQLEFVCFIDASEKELTAGFSDEAAFLQSVDRPKWSFAQE